MTLLTHDFIYMLNKTSKYDAAMKSQFTLSNFTDALIYYSPTQSLMPNLIAEQRSDGGQQNSC